MSDDTDTEVTYKFADLSERVKEKARDKLRYTEHYLSYEWWDVVYEDAVHMGKLIGVDISETKRRTTRGTTVFDTNIYFSGFSSQGDGASFSGTYRYAVNAVKAITEETNDPELLRIAQGLTLMQITQRLNGLEGFTGRIRSPTGNYNHSGGMSVDINDQGIDEIGEPDEEQFTQLMKDFADYIYAQLEQEHDYLMSDECVDEQLADEEFDEGGNQI